MQGQAQDVDRRVEQLAGDAGGQQRHGAVGGDHPPVAIDDQRRVGLVPGEDALERLADRTHLGLGQVALPVGGRVPRGEQQPVALAQRYVELLGELHDERRARPRAPRLHEAQVAAGDAGLEGEVELADVPALAPVAQQRADGGAVDDVAHERQAVSPPDTG
jgi:hypothetical protein